MRLSLATLALVALSVAWAPALAQKSKNRLRAATASPRDFVPRDLLIEAAREVNGCARQLNATVKPYQLCAKQWREIKWTLYSNWIGEITAPSGFWTVSCNYNPIERTDTCSFSSGLDFTIIRSDGYRTLLNWGRRRYPGSNMIARIDDAAPLSTTAETWTFQQSRAIYQRMIGGKAMFYRWSDWPYNASHDNSMNLSDFANFAALLEGIRDEFTMQRVLGKVTPKRSSD